MTLKDKIVDAAYELFGQKGYDKTSVAQIIDRAGASKGGFYHHFKSKEEILEIITLNYIKLAREHYKDILEDPTLSVVEKFVASFYRINVMKAQTVEDYDRIKNLYAFNNNHKLFKKMGESFEYETATFYQSLIEQGVSEGVFQVSYPKALAELWSREVLYFQQTGRHVLLNQADEKDFYSRLQFDEQLINQQLGLQSGTVALGLMGETYLRTMKQALKGKVS